MQVRAGRIAGAAAQANILALADTLPTARIDLAQMGIQGLIAISVVDGDSITVAARCPAREHDHARIGSRDGLSHSGANIDGQVPRPVVIARNRVIDRGPDKRSGAVSASLVAAGAGSCAVHAGGNPRRAARDDRYDPLLEFALAALVEKVPAEQAAAVAQQLVAAMEKIPEVAAAVEKEPKE